MSHLPLVRLDRDAVPAFEAYPFSIPAIRGLGALPLHPAVTYFVGENATGKSTLLEAIAVALGMNPEGGGRNIRFQSRASHSPLHRYLDLGLLGRRPPDGFFFRAESFFNLATEVDQREQQGGFGRSVLDAYGGRSLHEQSHGESFFAVFQHRMLRRGVYLLDEPEAALSPARQVLMLRLVHQMVKAGSQLIMATHAPILLAYPNAWIYEFSAAGIARCAYDQTHAVRITRGFLSDRERILATLLDG